MSIIFPRKTSTNALFYLFTCNSLNLIGMNIQEALMTSARWPTSSNVEMDVERMSESLFFDNLMEK